MPPPPPSAVTIDPSDDFSFNSTATKSSVATTYNPHRTLFLAPPSLSSHPTALQAALHGHDRNSTDIQMLDRLSANLVTLPSSTYSLVTLLSPPNDASDPEEVYKLLTRPVVGKIVDAMKPGCLLKSEDGKFGTGQGGAKTEGILAGLIVGENGGMVKPEEVTTGVVSLSLKRKNRATNTITPKPAPAPSNGTTGVGFVDFSNDLEMVTGEEDEDELIDEDDLLTEEDKTAGLTMPPECQPKPGKRRRACKDCSCGLKERLEAEDVATRASADQKLSALKLDKDDLAELDFTVEGKVGSCGNCALGDAFRCAGCPYIGLPAFKPGEEVRLLEDDIQL
jgi:hypothetical protein